MISRRYITRASWAISSALSQTLSVLTFGAIRRYRRLPCDTLYGQFPNRLCDPRGYYFAYGSALRKWLKAIRVAVQ